MDLQVLKSFLVVAREENITHAAELLHITQPTLSRQIAALETELEVKLFRRSKHAIVLTSEGTLFRRRAAELLSFAEKAKQELLPGKEELIGEIAIGCNECQAMDELADWIADFQRLHPRVWFDVYCGWNDGIRSRMERGLLDMGLFLEPAALRNCDYVRMSSREEWGALVPTTSRFAAQDAIRPGELVGTRVTTIKLDDPVHDSLATWSGDYAAGMANSAIYNLQSVAAALVRAQQSAAICLRSNSRYNGLVFVPFQPKLECTSVLAWKSRQAYGNVTKAFIDFVRCQGDPK